MSRRRPGQPARNVAMGRVDEFVRASYTHLPEAHVVYALDVGYRGQLRCRCGGVSAAHPRLRERYAEAEADARDMLLAVVPS